MQGYIKLFRKTLASSVFQDPYYFKLWMYCLMKASHKQHEQIIGNQMIELEPGQFVTGRQALAEDMNRGMKPKQRQSELTWWRHLNNLEKWQMLNIKKTNKYSVISIINWCQYQESEQEMNNKRTSNEQQLNTNKNVKNDKNENIYTDDFESFWKLYPRKADKKKANTSFKRVIKKHSLDIILEGTKGYIDNIEKEGTDKKYIKHGATFLNNDSFLDFVGSEEPKEKQPEQTEEDKQKERIRELKAQINLGRDYWAMTNKEHVFDEMERELRELEQL